MKKKFRCLVCGYVYEGENPPAECPVCHAKSDKFVEIKDEEPMAWACEHVIGVAKGCDPEIHEGLEAHFTVRQSVRAILKSLRLSRDMLSKRLSTLPSSQNFSVTWFGTPRPISKRESRLREVLARVSLPSLPRLSS